MRILVGMVAAVLSATPASAKFDVPVTPGTDIHAAVTAAIAAHPGEILRIGRGNYTLSGPLDFTLGGGGLEGDGVSETIIAFTGTSTAPLRYPGNRCAIRFGPGGEDLPYGRTIDGALLRGLSLIAAPAMSRAGDCGVKVEQAVNVRMTDVDVSNFPILIDLVGASNVFLTNVKVYRASTPAPAGGAVPGDGQPVAGSRYLRVRAGYRAGDRDFRTRGTAAAQTTYGVFLSNVALTGAGVGDPGTEVGIELLASDGFYMAGPNYVGQAIHLMDIRPENDQPSVYVGNVTITGALFDGNLRQSSDGIRILTNMTGKPRPVTKVAISGNVVTHFRSDAVRLANPLADGISITGNAIFGGNRSCLDLTASMQVTVSGNSFGSCGSAGIAGSGAILYSEGNTVVGVVGNTFVGTAAATDIVAPTMPTNLKQGFNATSLRTPVPVYQ
ncbi:hypothetical protein ACFSGX_06080 [Sphingomonas arantia]|uniref:Right handed beta helix domain-containing protein n=1 Tax=Sphingomonas arantia TaxID=1460676 RepID=A0ABW4TWI0_9SPHN